jgi:hypothetical protein
MKETNMENAIKCPRRCSGISTESYVNNRKAMIHGTNCNEV